MVATGQFWRSQFGNVFQVVGVKGNYVDVQRVQYLTADGPRCILPESRQTYAWHVSDITSTDMLHCDEHGDLLDPPLTFSRMEGDLAVYSPQ